MSTTERYSYQKIKNASLAITIVSHMELRLASLAAMFHGVWATFTLDDEASTIQGRSPPKVPGSETDLLVSFVP